jgi:hypothetical protein
MDGAACTSRLDTAECDASGCSQRHPPDASTSSRPLKGLLRAMRCTRAGGGGPSALCRALRCRQPTRPDRSTMPPSLYGPSVAAGPVGRQRHPATARHQQLIVSRRPPQTPARTTPRQEVPAHTPRRMRCQDKAMGSSTGNVLLPNTDQMSYSACQLGPSGSYSFQNG